MIPTAGEITGISGDQKGREGVLGLKKISHFVTVGEKADCSAGGQQRFCHPQLLLPEGYRICKGGKAFLGN